MKSPLSARFARMTNVIITWLVIIFPLLIASGKALSEVGMVAVTLLFVVHLFITRDFSFLKEKWVRAIGVFWLYLIVRSLFGPDIKHALAKSMPFVRFIIFAVCCETLANKNKQANRRILIAFFIAISFLVLDGFIQFFIGHDLFGRASLGARLTGPFSKPIIGTVIASFGIIAIAGLVPLLKGYKHYLLFITLASLLIFTVIFLSGERAALLRFISSLFILWLSLIYLAKDRNVKTKLFVIVGLTILLCTGAILITWRMNLQILDRQLISPVIEAQKGQGSPYLFLWWTGIKAGLLNILFGIGLNQYEFFCRANPHPILPLCGENIIYYHPHNIWLELFAELGLVGALLFTFVVYSLAKKLIDFCKASPNIFESVLAIGIGLAAFQRLLPLPSSGFFKNWYAITIWFAIGWMLCIIRAKQSKSS